MAVLRDVGSAETLPTYRIHLSRRWFLRHHQNSSRVRVALSGPLVGQTHRLLGPLRDLFAALFFLFFGLEIDPATLPPVLGQAAALAAVTGTTKVVTGWWAVRRAGGGTAAGLRAGAVLV